ncbi:MFS transporter [Microbulbifer sp. YPW16]|uniref:MFS transporter n=1 Tax=Microbulbifer sp. YPW16 TaxID=2904242 RepID=UPI001E3F987C|nr:MFS transporter [Microbulbifer sp. YPW16]UHQ56445.1 MFS transporter [Microbulbifer sp. YPW16]
MKVGVNASGAKPHSWRLYVVVASQGAAQVILLSLVPVIARQCSLDLAAIGSLVAVGTLSLMASSRAWGIASDRYGRRPVLLLSLFGTLIAQASFVTLLLLLAAREINGATAMLLLGLSRILYGISAAGVYPACQAWAVDLSRPGRELAALSSVSAAANLGRGFGPLLVIATLGSGEIRTLGWLALLPLIGLMVITGSGRGRRAPGVLPVAPRNTGLPMALFALAVLGTASIGQLQLALGPVLMDYYGHEAGNASSTAALILVAAAGCGALVQWTLGKRLRGPRTALALGALLFAAGAAIANLSLGSWPAFPGLLLVVAGAALLIPGYTTLLAAQGSQGFGRQFGSLSLLHTGGYTLGFAVGGWIYQAMPQAPLSGLLLGAVLIAVITLLKLAQGHRRASEKPSHQPAK